MNLLLYVPLIGLITVGIIVSPILYCYCKKEEKNDDENEKMKLIKSQPKLKKYDPLLI